MPLRIESRYHMEANGKLRQANFVEGKLRRNLNCVETNCVEAKLCRNLGVKIILGQNMNQEYVFLWKNKCEIC